MSEHDRPRYPPVSVLVLAMGIGGYLIVQSVILIGTDGKQTDQLVRTAWFVIVAVGVSLGISSVVLRQVQ